MATTTSLFKYVTNFKVGNNDVSVHIPIICHFSFPFVGSHNNFENGEIMSLCLQYKWKQEFKDNFINKLKPEFQQFDEVRTNSQNRALSSFLPKFLDIKFLQLI
jgi:hypothetical protein